MELKWTSKALSDLVRLYDFLAPVNKQAAATVVRELTQAPSILMSNPHLGEQLFQFDPRTVRRVLVGKYEMRYEVQAGAVYILRIWHTREER